METKPKVIIIALVLICLILGTKNKNHKEESEMFRDSYYGCQENLAQLNWSIENAQSWAWSSYENMGSALEDLEPIY